MFIVPDPVLRRAHWAQLQAISQRPAKGAFAASLRIDRAGEGFVIAVRADYDGVDYHYAESVTADGAVVNVGFAPAPEREATDEELYGGPSSDTRWQEAAEQSPRQDLAAALAEARILADGEAVDACGILLEAVDRYLEAS